MNEILHVGERAIAATEIVPLLSRYQLLPQLLREVIIDGAIAPFNCTAAELAIARQSFYQQHQLSAETARRAWCRERYLTAEQLTDLIVRQVKLAKFKEANWGEKVESYFLQRKPHLDQYLYSLLRLKDTDAAREFYFRIQLGEQSFLEIARQHSQGPEAKTGGLVGPVTLNAPHPHLAQLLAASQPGQLWQPIPLGDWIAVVRLEEKIPAQLDPPMRQHLLHELFQRWLQEQLQQADISIPNLSLLTPIAS